MSGVLSKIKESEKNRELYSSFINPQHNSFRKTRREGSRSYYLEAQRQRQRKKRGLIIKTSLGMLFLALAALGILAVGKRDTFYKIKDFLENQMEILKSKKPEDFDDIKKGFFNFLNNSLNSWYTFDKIKDNGLLKTAEQLGPPGKLLVKASIGPSAKCSEWFVIKKYDKVVKDSQTLQSLVERAINEYGKTLPQEEKAVIMKVFAGDKKQKGLTGIFEHIRDDFFKILEGSANKNSRKDFIQQLVEEKQVKPYNQNYFPQNMKWEEWQRATKNIFNDFFKRDLIRETWENTIQIINDKINSTGCKNVSESISGGLDYVFDTLKKIGIESKDPKFHNTLLDARKAVETGFQKATNFEKQRYAGRILDLKLGGGMLEILSPPVLGLFLTNQVLKEHNPKKRKKKFVEAGGIGLVGGLATFMTSSIIFSHNGVEALVISAISGMTADILGRVVLNNLNKNEKKKRYN